MADSPYQLDPFTRITNINFGSSNWFGVGCRAQAASLHALATINADFVATAGGTPGFDLMDASVVPPGFQALPHTVTAGDIKAGLVAQAGLKLTGFKMATPASPSSSQASFVVMKLDQFIQPFRIRMRLAITGPPSVFQQQVFVGVFNNGLIKPGFTFNNEGSFSSAKEGESVTTSNFDFIVDPHKLTVTGPV